MARLPAVTVTVTVTGDGDGDGDGDGEPIPGFIYIEPGSFMMGSPLDEFGRSSIETQHEVTLTRGFYLQETEVTQGDWAAVMGNNPSFFQDCGDSCPVETISWWDAVAYANARSDEDGLAPCYALEGCTGTPGEEAFACTSATVTAVSGDPYRCTGYRLATEAEWEYAYRAGTTTAFYNGGITQADCTPISPNADAIGWYCGNADGLTHRVAQKDPNAWGLYDMAGNVWEWCWDFYEAYPSEPVQDPSAAESGTGRSSRGGSRANGAELVRAAQRNISEPSTVSANIGLRLAKSSL